ncbi:hypothetical protein LUW75_10875 [Streptomyces sp. MRC013]|uniref:hypothetical protein n=1 Tax=Streptomyces sp. MRC013 TaxID=2898276 RepID=UPI002025FC7B|nr:hypothetical protein [Streptomyces sp. MRC013]URM90416.1 hypothetical protein LUW75_10875 [Streptomyces sp. MRC013]
MAALSITRAPVVGGLPDLAGAAVAASALGDTAPVGTGRCLVVVNADASPHTVTVATPGTVSGLGVADAVLTVAAGDTGILPLPRLFAQDNGRASITYDGVTSLSVAVLELGT